MRPHNFKKSSTPSINVARIMPPFVPRLTTSSEPSIVPGWDGGWPFRVFCKGSWRRRRARQCCKVGGIGKHVHIVCSTKVEVYPWAPAGFIKPLASLKAYYSSEIMAWCDEDSFLRRGCLPMFQPMATCRSYFWFIGSCKKLRHLASLLAFHNDHRDKRLKKGTGTARVGFH